MVRGITGLLDGFKYVNGKLVGGIGPTKGLSQGPQLDNAINKQVNDYMDTAKGYESDAYWYKESGDEISGRYSPNASERVSHNIGISSAQNPLSTNTRMAVESENARQLGDNIGAGKFKDQIAKTKLINEDKFFTIDANGNKVPVAQGNKIGPFTDTMVRNTRNSTKKYQGVRNDGTNLPQDDVSRTVHDIWDIRAMGAKKDALTATEHKFADIISDRAVARANKHKLGGRSDWTREQLQASVWEGQRAKGGAPRAGTNYKNVLDDEYTGTMPVETQAGIKASVGRRFYGALDEAQQNELMEAYKNAPSTMDGSFFRQPNQVGSWRNADGQIENNVLGVKNFTGTQGKHTKKLMEVESAIDTHILNQDAIGAQYYNTNRARTLNRKNGDIVRLENVSEMSQAKMKQLTELDERLAKEFGVDSVFAVVPADKANARNIVFTHYNDKVFKNNPEIAKQVNAIVGGSDDMLFVPSKTGKVNNINGTYMEQGEESAKYFYDPKINPMLKNPEYVQRLKERVKYLTKVRDDLHRSNGQKVNPFKAQAERLFVRGGPKAVEKGIKKWNKSAKGLTTDQVVGNKKKWSALLAMGAIPPAMAGENGEQLANREGARERLAERGIRTPTSENRDTLFTINKDFGKGLIAGLPEGIAGTVGEVESLAKLGGGLLTGGFQDWDKDLTLTDRVVMAGEKGLEMANDTIAPTANDVGEYASQYYSDDFNDSLETDSGGAGRLGGQIAGDLVTANFLFKLMKRGVKLTAKQMAQLKQAKEMQNLGR
jgi:hypothetical protein